VWGFSPTLRLGKENRKKLRGEVEPAALPLARGSGHWLELGRDVDETVTNEAK